MKVDPDDLKADIDELDCIDPSHIVTTDAFNLMIVYCVHRVMTSGKLSASQRKEAAINLLRLLHFKFVCGIITRYFPHGSDVQIALRTYEAMTNRFDLKIYKTWGKLITARAQSILEPNGIHAKTIQTFVDDEAIKYMLSDIQTRIRTVIKTLTALYYQVRENDGRVISVSSMVEVEGTLEVRDIKRAFPKYRRYLFEQMTDPVSFIRLELIDILTKNAPSQKKILLATLQYVSLNVINPDTVYSPTRAKPVKQNKESQKLVEFVERTLEYAFDFIHAKGINPRNLADLIGSIKSVLNASRNKEPEVMYLRTEGDKIVRAATGKREPTPVSAERTAFILYLILRTLTMGHYQN
jgi:flagellar biosynthesis/type III secretory pathway chaperone